MNNFSHTLISVIEAEGLTNLALARACGFSHTVVTRLIQGQQCQWDVLAKIVANLSREESKVQLVTAYLRDALTAVGFDEGAIEIGPPATGDRAAVRFYQSIPEELHPGLQLLARVITDRSQDAALRKHLADLLNDLIGLVEAYDRRAKTHVTPQGSSKARPVDLGAQTTRSASRTGTG